MPRLKAAVGCRGWAVERGAILGRGLGRAAALLQQPAEIDPRGDVPRVERDRARVRVAARRPAPRSRDPRRDRTTARRSAARPSGAPRRASRRATGAGLRRQLRRRRNRAGAAPTRAARPRRSSRTTTRSPSDVMRTPLSERPAGSWRVSARSAPPDPARRNPRLAERLGGAEQDQILEGEPVGVARAAVGRQVAAGRASGPAPRTGRAAGPRRGWCRTSSGECRLSATARRWPSSSAWPPRSLAAFAAPPAAPASSRRCWRRAWPGSPSARPSGR